MWSLGNTDAQYIIYTPVDSVVSTTVPAGCNIAIFSYSDAAVYVGTETFTLPSTSFVTDKQVELAPPALQVTAGATLYFRSRSQGEMSIKFGVAGDNTT